METPWLGEAKPAGIGGTYQAEMEGLGVLQSLQGCCGRPVRPGVEWEAVRPSRV